MRARVALAAAVLAVLTVGTIASAGPGDPDPTFGTTGVTRPAIEVRHMARDADGNLIVTDTSSVMRLRPDGSVDPTFNGGNAYTAPETIAAVAVQPDGKVLLAGVNGDFGKLTRLNANGTTDTGFATAGTATLTVGTGTDGTGFRAVALEPDGRVVVAGVVDNGANTGFVARYRTDAGHVGTLDAAGFNAGGTQPGVLQLAAGVIPTTVTTTDLSKMLVGGSASGTTNLRFYVARLKADGTADAGFGPGGVRQLSPGIGDAEVASIALSGNLIVAGGRVGADPLVAEFNDDGTPVTSFGVNGVRTFAFPAPSPEIKLPIARLAVRSTDGEILTAGIAGDNQIALIRLTPSGALDARFDTRSANPGTKLISIPGSTRSGARDMALAGGEGIIVGGFVRPGTGVVAKIGTSNRAPVIGAASVPDTAVAGKGANTLTAVATDPDPDDVDPTLRWDFGDGATADGGTVTHQWATPGDKQVRLVATDPYSAVDTRTFTVHVLDPGSVVHASIVAPNGNRLVSGAPFPFSVKASSDAGGEVSVSWDFGEGRDWTRNDVDHPELAGFLPDPVAAGTGTTHRFTPVFGPETFFEAQSTIELPDGESVGVDHGVDGTVPPVSPPAGTPQQAEKRRTYLVRAKVTDRFGDSTIVGQTVVVLPDQPPFPAATVSCTVQENCKGDSVEYDGPTVFRSFSSDPDNALYTGDPGGRDTVIRERWNFHDGSTDVVRSPACPACAVVHDFFHDGYGHGLSMHDLPASVVGDGTAGASVLAKYASGLAADGPSHTGKAQLVTLTATDRTGRTHSKDFYPFLRKRRAPSPHVTVVGADAKGASQQINTPLVADNAAGPGTRVTLDLSPTKADPQGTIEWHVLRIGQPAPSPCPKPYLACTGGHPSNVSGVVKTMVVKGNGQYTFTFPSPSPTDKPWSIQDTAYDETGATGVSRYDGFAVNAGAQDCADVPPTTLGQVTFSGDCLSTNHDGKLVWTKRAVDVNGLKLKPAEGNVLVVADCDGHLSGARIFTIASGSAPKPTQDCAAFQKDGDAHDPNGTKDMDVPVSVLAGSDTVAVMGPKILAKLPLATGGSLGGVTDARYKGFRIESNVLLHFPDSQHSHLGFLVDMPPEFSAGGVTTEDTKVDAQSPPAKGVVITEFDGLALASSWHRKRPHAHVANGVTGAVIDAASGISLGPIPLPPLPLTYDKPTDTFTAEAHIDAGIPLLPGAASLKVVLQHGSLVEVSGSAEADVPIAGAIDLTGFSFRILPTGAKGGLSLSGTANFADTSGEIVTGAGTVSMDFGPSPMFGLRGQGTVLQFIPVTAGLAFSGSGVRFDAGASANFGPASFSANMTGGFAYDGKHFQIAGGGSACLALCLHVQSLFSERAVAACGSIDLFLVSLTAGFGYVFSSKDLDVFAGSCNLSKYGTAEPIGRAAQLGLVSYKIPTRKETALETISIPRAAAVGAAPGAANALFAITPQVRLLAPGGAEIARTSDVLGSALVTGAVGHRVLTDQDPLTSTTRFVIQAPATSGTYTVEALPGSISFDPPQYAFSDPPADAKHVFAGGHITVKPAPDGDAAKAKAGKLAVFGVPPGAPQAAKKVTASHTRAITYGTPAKPLALSTVRQPLVKDPTQPVYAKDAGMAPVFKQAAVPAHDTLLADTVAPIGQLTPYTVNSLLRLDYKGTLPPGETVEFSERAADSFQALGGATAGSDAKYAGHFDFSPSVFVGAIRVQHTAQHCITAAIYDQNHFLRGTIDKLACFKIDPPPVREPPSAEIVINQPKGYADIDFDPNRMVEIGDQQVALVTLTDGPMSFSTPITANGLAARQASHATGHARVSTRAARTAAFARITRTPVAKRSYRLRIYGLPRKGHHKVHVAIRGVDLAADTHKVMVERAVLGPHHKRARVTTRHRRHKHRRHKRRH